MAHQTRYFNERRASFVTTCPLQVLFDTLLQDLKRLISLSATTRTLIQESERNSIACALHNFGVLCSESHNICVADPTFAPVIYYERVRMGFAQMATNVEGRSVAFSMECVPASICLFGKVTGVAMHPNKCRDLTSNDLLNERNKCVSKLESSDEAIQNGALGVNASRSQDVPSSLPQKVHVFILVLRSILSGMKTVKDARDFDQCCNKRCNRVFYTASSFDLRTCYDPNTTPLQLLDLPPCNPLMESDRSTHTYWLTCGRVPFYQDVLKRFCSSACCIEWRNRLDSLLPSIATFDLENNWSSASAEKRVHMSFNAALSRNAAFCQQLATIRKTTQRSKCLSKKMLKNEIDSRIDIMNIDLGVLYWATIMCRLPPSARSNLCLPGTRHQWRRTQQSTVVAQHISALYVEAQDRKADSRMITTCLSVNRFFSTIKTRCNDIKCAVESSVLF